MNTCRQSPSSVCLRYSTYPIHSARRELEELRRLRLNPPMHDPVAVSVRSYAERREHQQLEHVRADERRPRDPLPERDRQPAGDEHQRDADHGEHGLLDHRVVRRLARGGRGRGCRRQHHHQAEAGEHQRRRGDQEELARHRREDLAERHACRETPLRGRLRRRLGGVRGRGCVVVILGPPLRSAPSPRPRNGGPGRRRR